MKSTFNLHKLEWMVDRAGVYYFRMEWIQKGRGSNIMGGNVDLLLAMSNWLVL